MRRAVAVDVQSRLIPQMYPVPAQEALRLERTAERPVELAS